MALISAHYKKNLAIFAWIRRIGNKARYLPIVLIDLYRHLISPFTIPSCRFYPTCSAYARGAFMKYGLFKGGIMTLKRICKCHPFHPGGYDPVD